VDNSCKIVVQGSNILLVKGGEAREAFKVKANEAEKTYKALNTDQGINWLMRRLSGI